MNLRVRDVEKLNADKIFLSWFFTLSTVFCYYTTHDNEKTLYSYGFLLWSEEGQGVLLGGAYCDLIHYGTLG